MSKAFIKEDDGEDDVFPLEDRELSLPLGAKNYMTPEGHAALVAELRELRIIERPKVVEVVAWAAGNGDRSENGDYIYGKKKLREIDRRIRFLMKRLDNVEVVNPKQQQGLEQIFFGATVTYENAVGVENTIRIVGVDEAKTEKGQVSWISPIARALHRAREGDIVQLRTPSGVAEIEVVKIDY
ncbi:MAG: Transcription elongation factor GreB [Alphaproteobacteria bacterium MarineAlpha4_Bin2]|nr:MAG: Transcription elongation factor GreB [Alphaproteobacteria bacterium MarineAlpha4_Bin2]|tara:strand:- start:154 stop:705 length:552 start_codon:yes stop_codon:yes gene_type:complete